MTSHHFPFDPEKTEEKLAESLKTPTAKAWYEKLLLGKQIQKLRKKLNLNQRDFAQKLKTSQSVVARIEHGKQNLTLDLLVRIVHILGKKLHIRIL